MLITFILSAKNKVTWGITISWSSLFAGLAIGVLNLSIVIPQIIVALGAGPWDALFGGGNVPAFVLASVFAFAAGIIAVIKLPHLSRTTYKPAVGHGFGWNLFDLG